MRHVILTCKLHPNLRWSTKEVAVNSDGTYNGARNIFFHGEHCADGKDRQYIETEEGMRFVRECPCHPSELIRAPEDAEAAIAYEAWLKEQYPKE